MQVTVVQAREARDFLKSQLSKEPFFRDISGIGVTWNRNGVLCVMIKSKAHSIPNIHSMVSRMNLKVLVEYEAVDTLESSENKQ